MDTLKAAVEVLKAALSTFLDALLAFLAPSSPTPEPSPEPPRPEPIKVFVDAKKDDKALLHEIVGHDKEGKPIMDIWHDENDKVARFEPGTIFTVSPSPVIATGGMKFWQLYYKNQFFVKADACTKI